MPIQCSAVEAPRRCSCPRIWGRYLVQMIRHTFGIEVAVVSAIDFLWRSLSLGGSIGGELG